MLNENHEFQSIKFVLNTDADSEQERKAETLADPRNDHIKLFLDALIDNFS